MEELFFFFGNGLIRLCWAGLSWAELIFEVWVKSTEIASILKQGVIFLSFFRLYSRE